MTVGETVTITAKVVPAPAGGTVVFTDDFIAETDPAVHILGQVSIDPSSGTAAMNISATSGLWGIVATFSGFDGFLGSRSTRLVIPALEHGTVTHTAFALMTSTVEAGVSVSVTATVTPPAPGTVEFTTASEELGSGEADAATGIGDNHDPAGRARDDSGVGDLPRPRRLRGFAVAAGDCRGDPDAAVHPVDTGVSSGVFYPVKDGYKDTVDIRGVLLDPARVSLAIYGSASKRVRKADLGEQVDAYSWAWNGRDDKGKLLPAGKYKVVQTFRDAAGHTATAASTTTISLKKLEWKKGVITKNGEDVFSYDSSPFGWVSTVFSDFAHGVDLYGNIGDEWAMVLYKFKLPSAIRYGKLTFAVLGQPHESTSPRDPHTSICGMSRTTRPATSGSPAPGLDGGTAPKMRRTSSATAGKSGCSCRCSATTAATTTSPRCV